MLAPAVGAAVALILVVMIAVLASSRGGRPSPKPEYPAVTGRLGTDLQRLEQVVP